MPKPAAEFQDGYDLAEAFAAVAHYLRETPDRPGRLELSRWREDSEVRLDTKVLSTEILRTGLVGGDQIGRALAGPRGAYVFLRAVDWAFATLDPYAGTRHYGMLGPYRRRYRRLGRYNEDASMGAVVPRRSFPARPQQVPDHEAEHLRSLMIVPAAPDHVRFRVLEPELDFPDVVRQEDVIVVGCVPFLAGLEELTFQRIEDVANWYAIKPRSGKRSWDRRWQTRIREVLNALDDSPAHIGLLPELTLTDQLLTWWTEAVLDTPRPVDSKLEWIVAGTGPLTEAGPGEQPPNRAVLIHRRTGEVVLEQDKCEPFTLTDTYIRNWGLRRRLGRGPLAEWMKEGTTRWVVDSRIGRLSILVCEDHGRLLTVGSELATFGPTLLLIPIFAPPILRYRWQEQSAAQFANTTGSASVVATSDALPLPRNVDVRQQAGTALALVPTLNGPSAEWATETFIADSRGMPAGVVTFTLPRC